ncbi:MAG: hypothetical protein CO128_08715 [Ignavibacteriales bacterium CG_4_9_14_3_um_filter_30_11]|nr:MAG: hypothetical protein CO128_08715 [Ignavibacteriales bacterium CG_4_9_14_3_um_filter_30_11]
MKKLIFISVISFFLLSGFLCSEDIQILKGTVIHINLEGGFWGIIGDNEKNYDPQNLPENFKRDSLRVSFEYKISENQASTHMWGQLIDIVKIVEI